MGLVVEEFRNFQEPAPIPLHLAVAKLVSNNIWDQLRKSSHVTHNIAVSSDPLHITSKVVNVTAETVVTTIGKVIQFSYDWFDFFLLYLSCGRWLH